MPEAATDVPFGGVAEQARLFRSGALSPLDVVRAQLEAIERLDPTLRAFITVRAEGALRDAQVAEGEIASGRARSQLHGVTVAVKDQMLVEGVRMTGGSRVIDLVADRDATAVARLRAAGAIVLGTLNTHEFHAGPTRVFPFGTPRNPWNLDHAPGGSSSGSASAVAAGLCTVSMGGDTGGSIRGPAVDVRHRRPQADLVAHQPRRRHPARPLPRRDRADGAPGRGRRPRARGGGRPRPARPHRQPRPRPGLRRACARRPARAARGGHRRADGPGGLPADVIAATEAAIAALVELGATVERVSIPLLPHALELMWALVMGEARDTTVPGCGRATRTTTRTRAPGSSGAPSCRRRVHRRAAAAGAAGRPGAGGAAALRRAGVADGGGRAAARRSAGRGRAARRAPWPPATPASPPTYQAFNLSGHTRR
jgi:Asp-tRNA(Asn)/Glu-tRNA(Gln) amidotransferase A subunit family amidase